MKMILKWRKHPYITRVGIFLIAAALIVGMVSCITGATYNLTMAVAPPFSGTATDVTGGSPYEALTTVQIQAAANGSYQFCKWTSSAGGLFADPNNPNTTFLMPANDVIITANFVGPLDHFKAYAVNGASSLNKLVSLKDQFIELDAKVTNAAFFCNPTDKVPYEGEPTQVLNPDNHLAVYWIEHQEYGRSWNVEVTNQFNGGKPQYLTVGGPVALAVPTQKLAPRAHNETLCCDHYLVYVVMNDVYLEEPPVQLKDEFGPDPEEAYVGKAIYFANPVQKTVGTEVTNITTDEHLVFYELSGTEASCQQVTVVNQFSQDQQFLNLGDPAVLLGVPSEKVDWGAQYDHFTVYEVTEEPPYVGQEVTLVDQLVGNPITTNVTWAYYFCNPAWKSVTETPGMIVYPDYHLTLYGIDWSEYRYWTVIVNNQFGQDILDVYGPVGLAVPTQKLVPGDHEFPEGVDHFLLYEVSGTSANQDVALKDQFVPDGYSDWVTVYEPVLFAVPAEKKVGNNVTPIANPLTHLVFYYIEGAEYGWPQVTVRDQFHEQILKLDDEPPYMLGVPSLKLYAVEE